MQTVWGSLRKLAADRRGVSSTELGVVLALVALGSIQALSSLGQEVEQDLDLAKAEVERNRSRADPFARGVAIQQDGNSNRSINTGGDGGAPEPAAGSDGGLPEPAAASVAPEAIEWGQASSSGGNPEPAASVRVVPPQSSRP